MILSEHHIIPVETPASYPYLSAILLNEDYYKLLLEHSDFINGIHLATPLALILLKIHACLNLVGDGSSDAKKHFNDVIRLAAILDGEEGIALRGLPKEDYEKFLTIISEEESDRFRNVLASSGIYNVTKSDILGQLKKYFH